MKSLPPGGYIVRPYKTFKGHSHKFTYGGGSNPPFVTINDGLTPPTDWLYGTFVDLTNDDGTHKYQTHASVNNLFYPQPDWADRRGVRFNRQWSPSLTSGSGVYVVSISQRSFGEQIRPGTFRLTTTAGSEELYDNGEGVVVVQSAPTTVIGNIFYNMGIAVIGKMADTDATGSVITTNGMYLKTGNDVTVQYESQVTLYEHTSICTIGKQELTSTSNPSLYSFATSSVSGSTSLMDAYSQGLLPVYMTTIGLYNSVGELVAIGKLPRPIKRAPEIEQTFIVKFDI